MQSAVKYFAYDNSTSETCKSLRKSSYVYDKLCNGLTPLHISRPFLMSQKNRLVQLKSFCTANRQ